MINNQKLKYYVEDSAMNVHWEIEYDWKNHYNDCKISQLAIYRNESCKTVAMVVFERVNYND